MDVIASSSELSDLSKRIYRACTATKTREMQSWTIHAKCSQIDGYVLTWKTGSSRNEFLEKAGPVMMEMVKCYRKALKLITDCGCECWLQRALARQHGELEFLQLVEELELCVEILEKLLGPDEAMGLQVAGDNVFIREELNLAAHRDKEKLISHLQTYEDNTLCKHSLYRLRQSELDDHGGFQPLEAADGEVRWEDGSQLGRGASGTVYKAQWQGLPVAAKVFRTDDPTFKKELATMSSLVKPHPHVLQILCYSRNANEQVIAMELMKMDLRKFLDSKSFSLVTAVDILLQVARGTRYLHSQRIVHRDLKPLNILVDFDDKDVVQGRFQGPVNVLLTDFGISRPAFDTMVDGTVTNMRGTLRYMAPEMMEEDERYSRKVDVYSFAVLCSEVLTGSQPFGAGNISFRSLKLMLTAGKRPRLPEDCPEELVGLIKRCWSSDPETRPSFDAIEDELLELKKKLLAPRESSTNQFSSNNNSHSTSSGSSSTSAPVVTTAAGIQDLRITGSAEVGGRLKVHFRPINGTEFCICRWISKVPLAEDIHKPVMVAMSSAASAEFKELALTLTADDCRRSLELQCLPLTSKLEPRRIEKSKPITVRNSEGEAEIRRSWERGHASFKVERLHGRFWDPTGKLLIEQSDYLLWWGHGNPNNSRFNFGEAGPNDGVPIELSRENGLQCNLRMKDGSLLPVKFSNSRARDTAVLTMMYFWDKWRERG